MAESRWEEIVKEYESKKVEYEERIKKIQDTEPKTKEEFIEKDREMRSLKKYMHYKEIKGNLSNILEYRKNLEQKLEELPKDTSASVDKLQEEYNKVQGEIEKHNEYIDNYREELKNEKDEAKKNGIKYAIQDRTAQKDKLNKQLLKLGRKITAQKDIGENFNEEVAKKKESYENSIKKCNLLATELLNGKSINNIDLSKLENSKADDKRKQEEQETGDNVQEADKEEQETEDNVQEADKEEQETEDNVQEADKEEQETENNVQTLTKTSKFARRFPKIANFFKNIKNKIADIFRDDEGKIGDNVQEANKEEQGIGDNVQEADKEEQEIGDNVQETDKEEQEIGDNVQETDKEEKGEAGKQTNFRYELKKEYNAYIAKHEEEYNANIAEHEEAYNKIVDRKIYSSDKYMKEIAEKGMETVRKEIKKELYGNRMIQKTKAANEYAKNYGGAYERQDGATEKKTENKDKSDGMEPGDE